MEKTYAETLTFLCIGLTVFFCPLLLYIECGWLWNDTKAWWCADCTARRRWETDLTQRHADLPSSSVTAYVSSRRPIPISSSHFFSTQSPFSFPRSHLHFASRSQACDFETAHFGITNNAAKLNSNNNNNNNNTQWYFRYEHHYSYSHY